MVTPRFSIWRTIVACCRLSTMSKRARVRLITRPAKARNNFCRRPNAGRVKMRDRSLLRFWSREGDTSCCIEPDLFHGNVTLAQGVQFNPLNVRLKQGLECIIHQVPSWSILHDPRFGL